MNFFLSSDRKLGAARCGLFIHENAGVAPGLGKLRFDV